MHMAIVVLHYSESAFLVEKKCQLLLSTLHDVIEGKLFLPINSLKLVHWLWNFLFLFLFPLPLQQPLIDQLCFHNQWI